MGYFEDIQKFVRLIPRGKVATYGSVAQAAGHPGTARQVAWALRDTTAPAMPWQRVLGHDGKILLQGQAGLRQRVLLELEGVGFRGPRVDMKRYEFHFPRSVKAERRNSRGIRKSPQVGRHRSRCLCRRCRGRISQLYGNKS